MTSTKSFLAIGLSAFLLVPSALAEVVLVKQKSDKPQIKQPSLSSSDKKLSASATPGSLTYVYDDFGRLSQVKDGNKVLLEYQYDAAGNRTQVIQAQ